MTFTGESKFPCSCVSIVQTGDTFKLEVDKTKITQADSGTFELGVIVVDNYFITSFEFTNEKFEIIIAFVPKVIVEEVVIATAAVTEEPIQKEEAMLED